MTNLKKQLLPTVALIGRTNVGKSTIFNKLTEEKGAIISKIPGTTRDRKFGRVLWLGQTFLLVDTAGMDVSEDTLIDREAINHAKMAAKDADLILFVVDARDGMLPQDREYAKLLQKMKKPYLLVANKVDSLKQFDEVGTFIKLGVGEPWPISAATGSGTGDLLEIILKKLKRKLPKKEIPETIPEIKITLAGKPNVGKSSLLNKIAGEERVIVSEVPHTTRDSQDINVELENEGQKAILNFIDTAGIRKRHRIHGSIEKASIDQSVKNIKKADLVLLVIDASTPISIQDKNISREILENNKSVILVINKWDLVQDKSDKSSKDFTLYVHQQFPYLTWAPIIFISAKTGEKISRLIKTIFEVHESQKIQLSDRQLDHFLDYLVKKQPPQKSKGIKPPYIRKLSQIKSCPPVFEIIADQPENIHFSYLRYIQNELRDKYKLYGVGIKLHLSFPAKRSHVSRNTPTKTKKSK
jgi:GTP-binding protein